MKWMLLLGLSLVFGADGRPPQAKQIPHLLKAHGDTRQDPFYWLRRRDDPRVLDYLRAENAYADEKMKPTVKLQARLVEEMKSRLQENDSSYPARAGHYMYYVRMEAKKDYPIYCRKKIADNALEEILLDVNELARGHAFTIVNPPEVRDDETMIAYAVDHVGNHVYTTYFRDLTTGKLLSQTLTHTTGVVAWGADNQTVFFVKSNPKTLRAEKLYRTDLRRNRERLIYFEKNPEFDIAVERSLSKQFIFATSLSHDSTEVRWLRADHPQGSFRLLQKNEKNVEYSVYDGGDRFYILTNWQAPNFRVVETAYDHGERRFWRDVVVSQNDVLIENIEVFKNYLAVRERRGGLDGLRVLNLATGEFHALEFKDPAYVADIRGNREFETAALRFHYESPNTPDSVMEYNFADHSQILRKQDEVLGGFRPENYKVERLWASGEDGVRVPVSLVYRKGQAKSANTPLLVTGYGAYGTNTEATFNPHRLNLLDRGFIVAMVHARGGSEMGRSWYLDGKLLKKKNTISDFLAGVGFLHAQGYSSPAHTVAYGSSAGGLLIGASVNLRPDLFNGAVIDSGFVDVLTTSLDASLPLTTSEYSEWGNPNNKQNYSYIKSYSPYDNIKPQVYPHMLVLSAYQDSEVRYWEAAKFVAKLRLAQKDPTRYLLLHTEMNVGHFGHVGRYDSLPDIAIVDAFLLNLENIH